MISLSVHHLHKSYARQPVLSGLDLSLQQGQCFALVGQNGAGKTTLLRILAGQLAPDQGALLLDQQAFGSEGWPDTLRRHIGVAMGGRMLPPELSPYEYLSFIGQLFDLPATTWQARRDELLAWLVSPADHHKRLGRLSSGNRMKVALAAAYLPNPTFVLLDEPFNNLDLVGIQQVKRLIQGRKAQAITLISSHQLDILPDLCDQVGILHARSWAYRGEMAAFQAEGKNQLPERLLQMLDPQEPQAGHLDWQG